MKLYAIEQSDKNVRTHYSELLDAINNHIRLLAENSKPFSSVIGIKRALIRLRIDYLERKTDRNIKLDEEEQLLVTEIIDCLGLDLSEAVERGIVGVKEMKKQLVKYHYEQMAKTGKTYKEIKRILSEQYGISVASIEKVVYRKYTPRPKGHPPEGGTPAALLVKKRDNG